MVECDLHATAADAAAGHNSPRGERRRGGESKARARAVTGVRDGAAGIWALLSSAETALSAAVERSGSHLSSGPSRSRAGTIARGVHEIPVDPVRCLAILPQLGRRSHCSAGT